MNHPIVADGVEGLQVIVIGTVHLLIPLDQGAGAVLNNHPL